MGRPKKDTGDKGQNPSKSGGKAATTRGRGKGKAKAPKQPPLNVLEGGSETDETIDHDPDQVAELSEATSGHESSTSIIPVSQKRQKMASSSQDDISMDQMKKIASFFEGMPMFYDLADEHYKNTQLRDMKLAEFAKEVDLSREYLFLQ